MPVSFLSKVCNKLATFEDTLPLYYSHERDFLV